MRRLKIGAAVAAGAALVAGVPAVADAATGWQTESIPNSDSGYYLQDSVALSANDVWAIGPTDPNSGDQSTVLLHWDGTNWLRKDGPAADRFVGTAISGVSGSDIWAAGNCVFASGSAATACAAHWDGTKWGTPVQLPKTAGSNTKAAAVHAISANDVWVAGSQIGAAYYAHFDGSKWTKFSGPKPSGNYKDWIADLAATGPHDVWAAGYGNDGSDEDADRPIVQHWNGTSWASATMPNTGGELTRIATLSGTRVWAVGEDSTKPLVLRRSGNTFYNAPAVPGNDNWASGVASDGADGAWVALCSHPDYGGGEWSKTTHYVHFTGGAWTAVQGNTYSDYVGSEAVTQVPGTGELYAVGTYGGEGADPTGYVERYGG